MRSVFTKVFLLIFYSFFSVAGFCQEDTEFPPGFIMHARVHNGMVTNFHRGADLYVGGVQFVPQVTVVPQLLRAGIVAGGFYTNKKIEGQLGPVLSLKLKTIKAGPFGTAANLHLTAEHLWGTGKQKLVGGGLHADLLNLITLGITAHRDYEFNNWWLQTALGFRISKKKKTVEPFNQ